MGDRYLFKAKRIDNGEWVTGYYAVVGDRNVIIEKCAEDYYCTDDGEVRHGNQIHEVNPKTICQCTWLKDKNGNLIFENDLMDGFIYPYLSGLDSEHDYFAEICWCDDFAGFGICTHKYKNSDVRGSADGEVDLMEDFDSSKWEIIGNIFDNNELLESEE